MIGKGMRSDAVKEAMKKYKAVYFAATGGAGALLAKRVKKAEIVAYEDLGPEAIRRLEVQDLPVNVINDYHDYVDGIDLNTQRTPFSGGSGVLPSNLLKPKQAFWFATICLLVAMVIGFYFVMVK